MRRLRGFIRRFLGPAMGWSRWVVGLEEGGDEMAVVVRATCDLMDLVVD